jgi:hypothetical protein
MSVFVLGAVSIDTCSKNDAYRIGAKHVTSVSKARHTNYHFLFTGDQPWTIYVCDYRTGWVASWDDVDEIEQPSYFRQKTMFAIFFKSTEEYEIAILPEGQKMKSTYFTECVLRPLSEIC